MILLIDNYDSFTYNLYQLISMQHEDVKVVRNDEITLDEIEKLAPEAIVISPGPGRPEDAGICVELIRRFAPKIPILGVCLGHQAIGIAFGGNVVRAPQIVHGKKTPVFHSRKGLFEKVNLPFQAGRYHSLVVDKQSLPKDLRIDAETPDGLIMGIKHHSYPCFGIQFHPESILTEQGAILLANFVKIAKQQVAPC